MTEHAAQRPVHPLPSRPIRIAAAQAQAVAGDVEANVATVAGIIRDAARAEARLVVLPEKFLSGYEPDLIRAAPDKCAVQPGDPRLNPIADACRETGTAAVVGAAFHDQGDLYVSALVFDASGELVTRYDKQHLFKSEREIYRDGAAGCTLQIEGWRLGLGICYDSGFPEHARAAALDGCHAYVVGALFSVGNGYHESRTWFPARALDNTCYAVLANHIGTTGGWHACGSSAIWGPDGRPLAEAGTDRPELITADLDPQALLAVRDAEPMLRDLHNATSDARAGHQLG
ncbi:carbon-nitrogen hydrolase family protein [Streptomyces longispororuber]|uniref:carbon-nitrogen hydrolase family protein n=1 Tax=Streptomyces longispororuber TaxID=68230 RepID=UPI00210A8739|nr:carbon-nitrogen hydrolase family protein [Streptomyces longispororuber]